MGKIYGVIAALLLLLTGGTAALAQDATPAAGGDASFADTMGLPELAITASDTAFEGVPAETAAGRYVVTLTNAASEDAAVEFLQLPDGITIDDLSGPPPGAEGTPPADGGDDGGDSGPPP